MRILHGNTLGIGGGAAGLNAADELKKAGVDVLLIADDFAAGTSRNAGSDKQTYYKLSLCGAGAESVEAMAQSFYAGGSTHGDHAYAMAALSARSFMKLALLGVPFPCNEWGEFVGYQTDHDTTQRATSAGPLTSQMMVERLSESVEARGVRREDGLKLLSILTDGKYFGGCLDYIRQARPMTDTPILRKEFIIDEYQLYQACQAGADAVLLIAAALTRPDYERLTRKAHELGLEVLLEIHTEKELDYLAERPDMLGVNNRHLGTFHTDVENSFRIASLLPDDLLWVSESGISEPDTVRRLRDAGFRGFLMGEAFMRQPAPGAALKTVIQSVER